LCKIKTNLITKALSEASRKTSVPKSSISVHLKDNTKTGGGFIWKYA